MRELILNKLEQIEKDYHVNILKGEMVKAKKYFILPAIKTVSGMEQKFPIAYRILQPMKHRNIRTDKWFYINEFHRKHPKLNRS